MFEVSKLKNTALSLFKAVVAVVALGIFSPVIAGDANSASYGNANLWDTLRDSFRLENQYNRPEVQTQVNWLKNHKSYLSLLGKHSQPYLYYILQEAKKRNMPGEVALLPMIESTYNPFAYSTTGAAGLWQFTSGTGNNFGLKQNWWFDGRRDIYNSTNAALNYLCYLHRFFNGNWMLAIAAYHSGEGTVQRAVKYNGNHQRSTNFWSLNLPEDTHSYVPKLLAIAQFIESQGKLSSTSSTKLPYISNTPYFTRIDVGTQIDLFNAAHLAGISYPELLKLNPGNNRWTTAPKGPHMIVLPLDKVDVFVKNLKKIPRGQRPHLLAKHDVHFDFDPDLEAIPDAVNDVGKIEVESPRVLPAESTEAPSKPVYASPVVSTKKLTTHKVLHVVQKGESFWQLTQKYQVSEAQIREWNHLSAQTALQLGQKLTVWTTNNVNWSKSNNTAASSSRNNMIYYTIRAGDSLARIAHKYNVSLQKLMFWNTALQPTHLMPGKQLVIYQ